MQIEIQILTEQKEPKIIIQTSEVTEEIQTLITKLSFSPAEFLCGFCNDSIHLLNSNEIIRIYSEEKKIYAETSQNRYCLRQRLYEIQEKLDSSVFVRISHSEVINLKKVEKFDLSFSGTIRVILKNEVITYVSRRYVSKIKQILGI